MKLDEDVLADITKGGAVDLDLWPDLLKCLLARLDTITTDNFPKPTAAELLAGEISPATTPLLESSSTQPDPSSQASTQPTSSPPVAQQQPAPPPILGPSSSTLTEVVTPPRSPVPPPHPSGLHSADLAVIASLRDTLTTTFAAAPPHTIQRLAELLLVPRQHYTSLPKYLRALQRVLSVSSTATAFPLEPANSVLQNGGNSGATGGVNGTFGLGSDESLGGALLTPIPWLMRDDCGGEAEEHALSPSPGPAPGVGVTQGELLRMEQEAGVIPANQVQMGEEERKEVLKIGAEDVGPQPEGTVFPDAPATEEEIVLERRDEEMGDAPPAVAETVTATITTTAEVREGSGEKEKENDNGVGELKKDKNETKGEDEKMQD
ncbi:hypothetical protein BZA05DRAFT_131924 [Tricharina praecox]|uniref:uncharacterized protein n=1 Tax=Tricharina praecox TaxID=43433 RepID=UPI0022202ABF|nr:uncharacterized protein BZA05DRAFT_131924 [Tricharina praecox]KAI5846991.1 hypothetical protein BZA05DRAFT_131924 [Tricharina praecox]